MRSLRFNDLRLLSERDRKAIQVPFHPRRNLISGMNHVGKSSLTKQIFETFGASPVGKLEGWDNATVSLLTIEIDGLEHQIVRQLNNRALLSADGKLIFGSSKAGEWARLFGEYTEFNLVMSDKSERTARADAACLFSPFYINQDGGWTGLWRPFHGVSRFKNGPKSIVEYFTQIFPPQFYVAKAALEAEQREIQGLEAELHILNRTRDRLAKSVELVGPRLSAVEFEIEIRQISQQLTNINARQEVLRLDAVQFQEILESLHHQIALTKDALARFGQDFSFLSKPDRKDLVCPTCGAKHEESFLAVLNFAEDARQLSDMLLRLNASKELVQARLESAQLERQSLSDEYGDLQRLLETTRGDLKFEDVIRSAGSGAAFAAFDEEDRRLEELRNSRLISRQKLLKEMDQFKDRKRRTRIKRNFQAHYQTARQRLTLPARDVKQMQVTSRPDYSGSAGPREILAYYAAIWWTSSIHGLLVSACWRADLIFPKRSERSPHIWSCANQQTIHAWAPAICDRNYFGFSMMSSR
jgi:hypothetical protein